MTDSRGYHTLRIHTGSAIPLSVDGWVVHYIIRHIIQIIGEGLCIISGSCTCCIQQSPAWLDGFADQHVVGGRGRAGPNAQEGIERGVPGPAPIKAEDEFVQIVLEVDPS